MEPLDSGHTTPHPPPLVHVCYWSPICFRGLTCFGRRPSREDLWTLGWSFAPSVPCAPSGWSGGIQTTSCSSESWRQTDTHTQMHYNAWKFLLQYHQYHYKERASFTCSLFKLFNILDYATLDYVLSRAPIEPLVVSIPYSRKISRYPIFAEGLGAKILRSNFCRWTFQNRKCAFRLSISWFNFWGLPVNRENRKNWIPREFLAVMS